MNNVFNNVYSIDSKEDGLVNNFMWYVSAIANEQVFYLTSRQGELETNREKAIGWLAGEGLDNTIEEWAKANKIELYQALVDAIKERLGEVKKSTEESRTDKVDVLHKIWKDARRNLTAIGGIKKEKPYMGEDWFEIRFHGKSVQVDCSALEEVLEVVTKSLRVKLREAERNFMEAVGELNEIK